MKKKLFLILMSGILLGQAPQVRANTFTDAAFSTIIGTASGFLLSKYTPLFEIGCILNLVGMCDKNIRLDSLTHLIGMIAGRCIHRALEDSKEINVYIKEIEKFELIDAKDFAEAATKYQNAKKTNTLTPLLQEEFENARIQFSIKERLLLQAILAEKNNTAREKAKVLHLAMFNRVYERIKKILETSSEVVYQ